MRKAFLRFLKCRKVYTRACVQHISQSSKLDFYESTISFAELPILSVSYLTLLSDDTFLYIRINDLRLEEVLKIIF